MVDIRSTFEGHNCSQLAVAIAHGSCELPSNREYNSEEISYQSPMLQSQPLDQYHTYAKRVALQFYVRLEKTSPTFLLFYSIYACFASSCMAKHIFIGESVVLHLHERPELKTPY